MKNRIFPPHFRESVSMRSLTDFILHTTFPTHWNHLVLHYPLDISYYTFLWNYINENGKRRRRICRRRLVEDSLRRRRHGTSTIGAYICAFFSFALLVQMRKRRRQYLKCSLQMQWVHIYTCLAPTSMHGTTICSRWVQLISEDVERLQWNSDRFIYVDINEV